MIGSGAIMLAALVGSLLFRLAASQPGAQSPSIVAEVLKALGRKK